MTPLFIARSVDQQVLQLILRNDVDFIVVDTRMIGQTVRSGGFFEGASGYGEDAADHRGRPARQVRGPVAELRPGPRRPGQGLRRRGRCSDSEQAFADRERPGLPGTWSPWQVLGAGWCCCCSGWPCAGGCSTRAASGPATCGARRWCCPRPWLVGAVGALTGFAPLGGLLAAGVLLFAGVRLTQRPAPLPRPDRGTWLWGLAIGLVVVATVALATWPAWHGLHGPRRAAAAGHRPGRR